MGGARALFQAKRTLTVIRLKRIRVCYPFEHFIKAVQSD